MKYYTSVGSRETPKDYGSIITSTSKFLRLKGYWLRSGNARGADLYAEIGSTDENGKVHGDIYLHKPKQSCPHGIIPELEHFRDLASKCCSHFKTIKNTNSRDLITRNMCQVIGHDINNLVDSDFLLAWTPNGEIVGGTSSAIILAQKRNIPVFNYGKYKIEEVRYSLRDFLKEHMRVESLDEFLVRAKETAKYADIHREIV